MIKTGEAEACLKVVRPPQSKTVLLPNSPPPPPANDIEGRRGLRPFGESGGGREERETSLYRMYGERERRTRREGGWTNGGRSQAAVTQRRPTRKEGSSYLLFLSIVFPLPVRSKERVFVRRGRCSCEERLLHYHYYVHQRFFCLFPNRQKS